MDKDFYKWLAGFIDGDGCFNITLHGYGNTVHVGFHVTIAVKELDHKVMQYIYKSAQLGHLYFRNRGTDTGMAVWQTTNLNDSIKITEKVLPYLILKSKRACKFLKAAKWYLSTCRAIGGQRPKDKKLRTAAQMKKVVKCAINLNEGMQINRHKRNEKLVFWNKVIAKYYN